MSEETTATKKRLDINGELSQQDALGILIQGVRFGQTKGIYSLEDAALLSKAIAVFLKNAEPTAETAEPAQGPAPQEADQQQ